MELEEAIKVLKDLEKCDLTSKLVITKAVELVLKTLENSMPKKKIKDKIEELDVTENAEALEDIMNKQNYTITELVQFVLQELLEE